LIKNKIKRQRKLKRYLPKDEIKVVKKRQKNNTSIETVAADSTTVDTIDKMLITKKPYNPKICLKKEY